ncbi:uncharacterized [Tachysurus ichikawai]
MPQWASLGLNPAERPDSHACDVHPAGLGFRERKSLVAIHSQTPQNMERCQAGQQDLQDELRELNPVQLLSLFSSPQAGLI